MTSQELAGEMREVGARIERRRVVGVILAEVGKHRLAGQQELAAALDALATAVEHPEAVETSKKASAA